MTRVALHAQACAFLLFGLLSGVALDEWRDAARARARAEVIAQVILDLPVAKLGEISTIN